MSIIFLLHAAITSINKVNVFVSVRLSFGIYIVRIQYTYTLSSKGAHTQIFIWISFQFNSFHFIWFCFAPLLPLNNLVSSLDCNDRINCSIELTKKNNQTKPHRSTTFHLPLSTFHFVPSFQRIKYIIIQ